MNSGVNWFRIKCLNIPECVYDFMNKTGNSVVAGFTWTCDPCRSKGESSNPSSNVREHIKPTIQKERKECLPEIVKIVLDRASQCAEVLTQTYAGIVKKHDDNLIAKTMKVTFEKAFKDSLVALGSQYG